jgi:hypothetical protein
LKRVISGLYKGLTGRSFAILRMNPE